MSARGRRVLAVAVAGVAIAGGLGIRNGDGGGGADRPSGDHGEYTLVADEFEVDDESTWFFEEDVHARLVAINARLDDAAARAVQLAARAHDAGAHDAGTSALVSELETLRQALDEVRDPREATG